MSDNGALQLFVITGLSGAGKSSTLNALEDLGFETVDNLPLPLLEAALRGGGLNRPLAVGVDVRTRGFDAEGLLAKLHTLVEQANIHLTLIYLDCDDDILMRRYTESRRPHPLDGELPVLSSIGLERQLLATIKSSANQVVDTSTLTTADLKSMLERTYGSGSSRPMYIHLVSFGYRNGVPREADIVFDVRFLRNPHYEESLRSMTGLDEAVGAHVAEDIDYKSFIKNLQALLSPLLPRYRDEGKSYLTLAVGCTGGRHRSVFVAEDLAKWLGLLDYEVDVRHRDLNKP